MIKLLLSICALISCSAVLAQDPVHWVFSAKKIADGKYQLHITATVDKPWHTYSQRTPEGGPVPTKFTFSANPLVKLGVETKEDGGMHMVHDKTFDVDVEYYAGKVDFVQDVTLNAKVKTNLTGQVEFMACHDVMCLPPKKIPFTIPIQ